MSRAGGPNEIGKLSVGIHADIEGLRADLEQAKQVAAEGGKAIGEAVKEGQSQAGGGATDSPTTTAATGGPGQIGGGANLSLLNAAAIKELVALIPQAFSAMENLAGKLTDHAGAMSRLEFERAQSNESLSRSLQLVADELAKRTGGSPFTDPNNVVATRIAAIDQKIAALETRIATPTTDDTIDSARDIGMRLITAPFSGLRDTYSTGIESAQSELNDLKRERSGLTDTRDAVAERNRQRYTVGGVLEQAVRESGEEVPGSGRFPTGGAVSPFAAAEFKRLLISIDGLRHEMVKMNSGSAIQQQRYRAEIIGSQPGEVR